MGNFALVAVLLVRADTILEDISRLHVSELHALNGVPIAGFAVAQSECGITTQSIVYACLIIDTGGYIGAVPNAFLFSVCKIVFVILFLNKTFQIIAVI